MPSSNDIRATFLDYFARNGHTVVESGPLVPRNDGTEMRPRRWQTQRPR